MAQPKSNDDAGSYDFSSTDDFSDLVLDVENTKFHVHKYILARSSPVFQKMFTSSGFRENNAEKIDLPGKGREEFDVFLQVIYSDVICQGKQINDENYEFLLQLADEYQVSKVKHLCSKFLISTVKESNCLGIYKVAEKYSLEDVMEKCAEEASRKACSVLESSEEFRGLKAENRERVYAKRAKYFEGSLETRNLRAILHSMLETLAAS